MASDAMTWGRMRRILSSKTRFAMRKAWRGMNGWMWCDDMVAADLMVVDWYGQKIDRVRAVKKARNGIRVRVLHGTGGGSSTVCGRTGIVEFEAFVAGAKLVKRDKPAQTDG